MDNPKYQQTTEASRLSDKDFRRLIDHLYKQCGILIPQSKRTVLCTRLQQRLRAVGVRTFTEYIDWALDPYESENELPNLLNVLTTQKADFFQESEHFEYLAQVVLPDLIKNFGAGIRRELMVWSAGCSSGEEAYTLAVVLKEFSGHYPGINFKANILATDISAQVLDKASSAIYDLERVENMPIGLKQKYLLRSKDRLRRQVRVRPEIRDMVKFRRINFTDSDFGLREKMDIVFCRGMMAYFDTPTQERIIHKCCRYLQPGGFIFIGQAETLNNLNVPVCKVSPSVYQLPFGYQP